LAGIQCRDGARSARQYCGVLLIRSCSLALQIVLCVAVYCSALQRVAACCSVLLRVAACCSVLHCVAVYCNVVIRALPVSFLAYCFHEAVLDSLCNFVFCIVLQCLAVHVSEMVRALPISVLAS